MPMSPMTNLRRCLLIAVAALTPLVASSQSLPKTIHERS